MEGTMEQFTEKLAGLVELGKKNKNFLEYAQIDSYFKDMKLNSDMMEAIYDYLEQNGIDVLTLAAVADDDEDLDDPIEAYVQEQHQRMLRQQEQRSSTPIQSYSRPSKSHATIV